MARLDLERVGGACAILYTVLFIVFFVLFFGSEVADTDGAAEFLPLLEQDKELAVIISGICVVMALLVAVAGIGIFQMLRHAGSLTWIAMFGFVGGGLLVLFKSFVWMAMTLELAPAYVQADADQKATLAAVGDTLEVIAMGADMVGGVLVAGVGVLIFSVAMLQKNIGAAWIVWVGIFTAIVGGWLTVLAETSEAIELITLTGALGFCVWMSAIGIIAWRRPASIAAGAPSVEFAGKKLASTSQA